jgi:hypothetical protein
MNRTQTERHYSFRYTGEPTHYPAIGMEAIRILDYAPSWSTAGISVISNYFKIFSPIFEEVISSFDQTEDSVLFGGEEVVNGIIDRDTRATIRDSSCPILRGRFAHSEALRFPLKELMSASRVAIGCNLSGFLIKKKEITMTPNSVEKTFHNFKIPSRLTIQSTSEYGYVAITGTGENGPTKELVAVSNNIVHSKEKYTSVRLIESTVDATISNVIDGPVYAEEKSTLKREIKVDGNVLMYRLLDSKNTIPEIPFYIEMPPEQIFINKHDDIVILHGESIYCGKINISNESFKIPNQSYNNNKFIFVNSPYFIPGDDIVFSLDLDSIRKIKKEAKIKIEIVSGEDIYYLNLDGDILAESQYLEIPNLKNKTIRFQSDESDSEIIVMLHINGHLEPFSAGAICNRIPVNKINLLNVKKISIFNNNLVAHIGNLNNLQSYVKLARSVVVEKANKTGTPEYVSI